MRQKHERERKDGQDSASLAHGRKGDGKATTQGRKASGIAPAADRLARAPSAGHTSTRGSAQEMSSRAAYRPPRKTAPGGGGGVVWARSLLRR